MGDGLDVRNNTMAEDILECDYTLAAKQVMVTMRKLMEEDGGIDESLQVALTWFEGSKARERPVAGPGFPTRNRFGPLDGEPIQGEFFFSLTNVQAPIRPFVPGNFPVAAAA
jgi:hypothetical protein